MPRPHEGRGLYGPWQTSVRKPRATPRPYEGLGLNGPWQTSLASQGPCQGPMRALAYIWSLATAKAHRKGLGLSGGWQELTAMCT